VIRVRASRNSVEIKCKYTCRPPHDTKFSANLNTFNVRVGNGVVTVFTAFLKALVYYILWVSIDNKYNKAQFYLPLQPIFY
jgi:hypothetical protein